MNSIALVLAALAPLLPQEEPFRPQITPTNEVVVSLTVLPVNHLPLVEAEVDGVKATLLFDTGASHTTFDRAFVEKSLAEKDLQPVLLGGATNVKTAPACFHLGRLALGKAVFGDFTAMTVPLGHLEGSVGRRVDGIVGMNVIRAVPTLLSLGHGRVTFVPSVKEAAASSVVAANPVVPRVRVKLSGRNTELLVDSGSSFTFLANGLWPTSTNHVALAATDVNGTDAVRPLVGEKGCLDLGAPVEIKPLVMPPVMSDQRNLLGADTLLRYDLLIDWPSLSFRPVAAGD